MATVKVALGVKGIERFEFLGGLALDLYEMEMEQASEQLLRAALRSLEWSVGGCPPQPLFDEQGLEAAVREILG